MQTLRIPGSRAIVRGPASRARASSPWRIAASILSVAAILDPGSALADQPCEPAHLDLDPATLPVDWQRALADLVQATAREGLPWSCQGGRISLTLNGEGAATLTVVDAAGRSRERRIAAPSDLVPMAEALLAKPLSPPAMPPSPPPAHHPSPPSPSPPSSADRDGVTAKPGSLGDPRLLIDATLGPRYAGISNIVWGGATVRAAVPFGAGLWSAGAWARYDGPSLRIDGDRHAPPPTETCLGLTLGRRFLSAPVDLSATFDPSFAVISRGGHKHDDPSSTRIDARLGLSFRAAIPVFRLVRAVAVIDGDIAPREIADPDSRMMSPAGQPELIPFPAYTIGLSLGAELVLR